MKAHPAGDALGVGAALVALALAVSWSAALLRLDHWVFDVAQRWLPMAKPQGVVLVGIDQASLQELGRWPWSRQTHAALLQQICRAKPAAVALDIAFNEVGDDAAANQALASALASCGNVALPLVLERTHVAGQLLESPPLALLAQSAAGLGRVSVRLDDDGVARGIDLWEGVGTAAWPLLAQTTLQISGWRTGDAAYRPLAQDAGEAAYTLARREPRLLRFVGPAGSVPSISAAALLHAAPPLPELQGKIVLVGATAAGLGDLLPTPVTSNGAAMPGVEVLANVLLNLRDGMFIIPLARPWQLGLTALLALLPALWLRRLMPLPGLLCAGAWTLLVLGASMLMPVYLHLWFAPAGAMTAALLAYPLLSWRRLEAARRHLDWELQQLAGAGLRSHSLRRLGLEQRMAAVQQAQQRFHALQAQREEALAFLSHDVRAPLASAVQQLENDSLDAARKQRLLTQLRAAEHMVQDFLSLARAHALQPERLSEVDLAAIVHQAADALYAPAQAKSVQLLCTVPDEPVWMAGDFGLLERALGNLLRNALRFAPAGSLITLSLRVTPEQIELSVADQGPGVSAAMLPHLFEKFSPEQARGQHAQGTGLGLYFVRTVAQKLGAKSGHEAVAPHGARFWMRFPRL